MGLVHLQRREAVDRAAAVRAIIRALHPADLEHLGKDLRAAREQSQPHLAVVEAAAQARLAALRVARLVASVARGLRRQLPARLSLTRVAVAARLQTLPGPQGAREALEAAARAATKRQLGLLGPLIPAVVEAAAQTMEHPHLLVELVDLALSSCLFLQPIIAARLRDRQQ